MKEVTNDFKAEDACHQKGISIPLSHFQQKSLPNLFTNHVQTVLLN